MKLLILAMFLSAGTGLTADPRKPPVEDSASTLLSAAENERLQSLAARVIRLAQARTELPDGYRYMVDGEAAKLSEVTEWMRLERKNCPYLSLSLHLTPEGEVLLDLRGPDGTKDLLQMELPAIAPRYI